MFSNPGICPKCNGENKINIKDSENGLMMECETECLKCGHKNYWAHGSYMTSTDDSHLPISC